MNSKFLKLLNTKFLIKILTIVSFVYYAGVLIKKLIFGYFDPIHYMNTYLYDNSDVYSYFLYFFIICFFVPILEEMVFRSWLTKNIKNYHLPFLLIFISSFFVFFFNLILSNNFDYLNIVYWLDNINSFIYNFPYNLNIEFFNHINDFFYGESNFLFITIKQLPFYTLYSIIIIFTLRICFKKSLFEVVNKIKEYTPIIILALFSSILFLVGHLDSIQSLTILAQVMFVLNMVLLNYYAYNYSIKIAILLHIINNTIVSMNIDLVSIDSISIFINITQFIVLFVAVYLFFKSVRIHELKGD